MPPASLCVRDIIVQKEDAQTRKHKPNQNDCETIVPRRDSTRDATGFFSSSTIDGDGVLRNERTNKNDSVIITAEHGFNKSLSCWYRTSSCDE
jgi:hypothetical protein